MALSVSQTRIRTVIILVNVRVDLSGWHIMEREGEREREKEREEIIRHWFYHKHESHTF